MGMEKGHQGSRLRFSGGEGWRDAPALKNTSSSGCLPFGVGRASETKDDIQRSSC
jgi:hypothetical protein